MSSHKIPFVSKLGFATLFSIIPVLNAFAFLRPNSVRLHTSGYLQTTTTTSTAVLLSTPGDKTWGGDVVQGGKIRGCSITAVEGSLTDWIIAIDGVEADIGRFSEAIYGKFIRDAKTQRFQGFRPGTIPPHLEPTYRAFAMDECARETVLEAMQQNNIRPFENSRQDFVLSNICIPPPAKKGGGKKSAKSKKTSAVLNVDPSNEEASWLTFDTMKEAIDAGWRPGQSFSFIAKQCKGQKVKDEAETQGARPLGLTY